MPRFPFHNIHTDAELADIVALPLYISVKIGIIWVHAVFTP